MTPTGLGHLFSPAGETVDPGSSPSLGAFSSPFITKNRATIRAARIFVGDPYGTRTRVIGMRIQRPRPLDEGAVPKQLRSIKHSHFTKCLFQSIIILREHSRVLMFKLSPTIKVAGSFIIVASLFTISYFSFSNYQPKVLKEIREVKGYSTVKNDIFELPTPRYATSLAFDQTLNSKKYTFQTDRSPSEVFNFYKVILADDNWKVKKEGSTNDFFTAEYRKEDQTITVWAAYNKDTKLTFASVEILKLRD